MFGDRKLSLQQHNNVASKGLCIIMVKQGCITQALPQYTNVALALAAECTQALVLETWYDSERLVHVRIVLPLPIPIKAILRAKVAMRSIWIRYRNIGCFINSSWFWVVFMLQRNMFLEELLGDKFASNIPTLCCEKEIGRTSKKEVNYP